MVLRASPVADETVVTPPQPSADASAAAHCLRTRSSITGDRARYFCRIRSIAVASCMQQPLSQLPIPTIRICSALVTRSSKEDRKLVATAPLSGAGDVGHAEARNRLGGEYLALAK